jgi:hypothetical protein
MYKITLTKSIAKNGKPYFYAQSTKREGKKVRIKNERFYYLWAMAKDRNDLQQYKNHSIVDCFYTWRDFMFLTYGN